MLLLFAFIDKNEYFGHKKTNLSQTRVCFVKADHVVIVSYVVMRFSYIPFKIAPTTDVTNLVFCKCVKKF